MTLQDVLVIGSGLAIGYWLVSVFTGPRPDSPSHAADASDPASPDAPSDAGARPWHEVLGVAPDAKPEEARAAFHARMAQTHADKVATMGPEIRALAERLAKELGAAYGESQRPR